jgi:hypothetical protein
MTPRHLVVVLVQTGAGSPPRDMAGANHLRHNDMHHICRAVPVALPPSHRMG